MSKLSLADVEEKIDLKVSNFCLGIYVLNNLI